MEISVPTECQVFLAQHGAFEGFVAGDEMPGHIELWPIEAIDGNNREIEIFEYVLTFAGNGGDETLAFDSGGAVYMLPLIGMATDTALKVAGCFSELAAKFELAA